ncbi:CapA family protein [Virgibacillus alimentarius]|uniref:Poly-gamma-glutamate synthesis protein (Capsule biosynthesis protein) n=1 Tax=Virgibacillus alimentarius TaxID=698769 RepID=A0ABS4S7F3_9BACI|nr:CapA family protein [Virgibacillus alimentarius]MBP2257433.1 poly-gamma-glutamate synthesis protein (capsule biosynthesis protein) [Virgibacillus alimentarius]
MVENKSRKVTLAATGDILLHTRLYNKAKTDDGGYDFSELMAEAKPLFNKDHLTVVNQESLIGGVELGLSDFPHFNSPVEITKTLKEFNVDIATIANNHVLDKGEEGILRSIENWNKIGIPYVGAYNSKEDQETLRIFHKNGLRICFLSYTKRMAGVKIPKGKEYLVDSFEGAKVGKIRKRIQKIKSRDLADVIILSIHYGKEYQMLPTSDQLEISNTLSDAGADVILGHHPHVLQPPAYILNSRGKDTFCIYSLGNFFSGQKGIYRQIGAHMTIDIEKPSPEKNSLLKIDNPTFKLTYVDSTEKGTYKLHLLEDVVKNQKIIKTHMGNFDSKEVYNRMISHMRKWIPNLDIS